MEDKDTKKTLIYLLVAGMALLVAWEPWRPAPPSSNAATVSGTKLLPNFSDPLAAKSLEVTKFDEDTATVRRFQVGQTKGVWSIPSHSDYPADAKEHMASAATALLDLKIMGPPASDRPGDAAEFGVVTPDPNKLQVGAQGVGTHVILRDGKDNILADVIIGKEVKDQPTQRYVRLNGQDNIYVVAVKPDKFSTKFEDWIEKDLLKLSAPDVRDVALNDYSLSEGIAADGRRAIGIQQRAKIKVAFDDAKNAWRLVELTNFNEENKPEPAGLADDEELNNEKLNAMKTALDDLQIVDVQRKPKGLSQDLKASDEFVNDNEAAMSLIRRGFYPAGQNKEIFSSEGEVTCSTKDGVRYVLRFGKPVLNEDVAADAKAETDKKPTGSNRYLFLMAEFDENQIPKPKFEDVPGEKPTEEKAEEKPAPDAPATEEPAASPDPENPAADTPPATPEPEAAKPAAPAAPAAGKKPAPGKKVPQKKTADGGQSADEKAEDKEPAEKPAADDAKPEAEAKPEADAKPAEKPADPAPAAKPSTPEDEAKIAIQKENKRRQEEYDAAVKKGQDKVKELNDRFADWYFIISDDVYKKIHLGRADIVKKKEADKDKPEGASALQQLEKGIGGGKLPPLPPR